MGQLLILYQFLSIKFMNAIVEISGKQFKVEKDTKLFVNRLDAKEGDKVTFDNVLLLDNGSKLVVGKPTVKDATVEAKVLKHLKDDKVIVFKKKRRKGYKVKNGHRQALTEIIVEGITASGAKKAAPKKETKKAEPKAEKAAPKAAAKKATGKADDLKKIEGAGPKAAEALVNAGFETFAK